MIVTSEVGQKLKALGISFQFPGDFSLPDQSIFEGPCAIGRMQAAHSLEMGAFSYAKSGYYFAARIGRYCSIEDNVQLGRGSHPITWGSTSPVLYQDHIHVFNQRLAEAATFRVNAKTPPAMVTTVGHDVHIGYGALINQGVTIGNGAVIRPMAVVSKDVPPYTIVEGNPGTVIGMRLPLNIAAAMQGIAWWRFAFWQLPAEAMAEPLMFIKALRVSIQEGLEPHAPAKVRLSELSG